MLRLGLERAPPQRSGFGHAPEVDEREGAVVHPVRGAATATGLAPRIGSSGDLLPGRLETRGGLGEVAGAILGPLPKAPCEQILHRPGHRGPAGGGQAPSSVLLEHLGGGQPVLPRSRAHEHLEHGQREAPQVGAPRERVAARLLG